METAVFTPWLLFLLFSPAVPMCLPTDFTLYVEKPECDFCVVINTTICMGFCYSRVRTVCPCVESLAYRSFLQVEQGT